jgi:ABC-type glycerol-3-phosphate transport system substrate-binding protein
LKALGIRPVFIILIVLVTACQPASSPTPTIVSTPTKVPKTATPQPTATLDPKALMTGTVRVWLDWNPAELDSLRKVISAFLEQYPGITIAIAYYSSDELQSALETAITEGTAPTIIFGPSSWGPELWQEGRLLDLTIQLANDPLPSIDPLAWNQVNYDGAVIGLPLERQGIVLYRNRSLVAEAAATLAELVFMGQELKDDQIVGFGLDFGFINSASQISVCDGELFDTEGNLNLEDQAGYCWLRLMRTLRRAGRVWFNSDEDLTLFKTGGSGWLIESTLESRQLSSFAGVRDLVIDPWPSYSETGRRMVGFVWTENLYLIKGASRDDVEATWAFARFLLSPEIQLILSDPEGANHLPALRNLVLDDALQIQMVTSLSSGVPLPLRPNIHLYIEPLEGAVRAVAIQGASPELALDIALTKIEQALISAGNGE